MNTISRLAFSISMMLFCTSAAFGAGYSGVQPMASVKVHDGGDVSVVGISQDWNDPDACGNASRIVLDAGNPSFRDLYAAILTAHVAERDIKFALNGCVQINNKRYPSIRGAIIY